MTILFLPCYVSALASLAGKKRSIWGKVNVKPREQTLAFAYKKKIALQMNQLSYIRIYALQYQYLFNDLASLLWYRLMMIDGSTFIFLFFNQTLVLYKSI